jgi:GMP reductase
MRIETDPKLDFDDVLIRPKRSELGSRRDVDLSREFTFLHSKRDYRGIPIIAANMDTVGTFEMGLALREHKLATAIHKHYTIEELIEFFGAEDGSHFFYSMGILQEDTDKLHEVFNNLPDPGYICMDVANGYSERFAATVSTVREWWPKTTIMAGNVVTAEMTEQLILSGADIVKVGIGPGSVCTTRKITGVGYPQLSAIIECADAAHGLGGHICADGGCKVPGDIAKAFGAGADFVMLGGMLAGHDESGGEITTIGYDGHNHADYGKSTMKFYGMSSEEAMNKYAGGVAEYRASEGKVVEVPYRGPVEGTIQQILGGLRSACTYTGARRLKDLSKCTTFIQVNRQLNTVYGD